MERRDLLLSMDLADGAAQAEMERSYRLSRLRLRSVTLYGNPSTVAGTDCWPVT